MWEGKRNAFALLGKDVTRKGAGIVSVALQPKETSESDHNTQMGQACRGKALTSDHWVAADEAELSLACVERELHRQALHITPALQAFPDTKRKLLCQAEPTSTVTSARACTLKLWDSFVLIPSGS